MASLVSVPDDIKLEVLKHMDIPTVQALSIVHSSWTVPARDMLFRRVSTQLVDNLKLGRFLDAVVPTIVSSIRYIDLAFFVTGAHEDYLADARERRKWLRERDSYFGRLLDEAKGLKGIAIYLPYDSALVQLEEEVQLDRSTWIATFEALCRRDGLQTLQIAMPHLRCPAMTRAVGFADVLAQSPALFDLTALSLSHINAVGMDAFDSFCGFVQGLSSLSCLQLEAFAYPASALTRLLPPTVTSLEFVQRFGQFDITDILEALASKPNVRHLHLGAHPRVLGLHPQSREAPTILSLRTMCLDSLGDTNLLSFVDFIACMGEPHHKYSGLHTLCIDVSSWRDPGDAVGFWAPLVRVLINKVRFPSLRNIQIPDVWDGTWSGWEGLRKLSDGLAEHGIDCQASQDPAMPFRRFAKAESHFK